MKIEQRIENVKDWLVFSSGCYPFIVGVGMRNWTADVIRSDGYQLISFCGVHFTKNGKVSHFVADIQEYLDSAKKLMDDRVVDKIIDEFEVNEKSFDNFVNKTKKDSDYLLNHYDEFKEVYREMWYSGVMLDGYLFYGDILVNEMKDKYPKYHNEIQELIAPWGDTFNIKYQLALLKASLISNKEEEEKEIQSIKDDYYWILNNYRDLEPLGLDYFKNEIEKNSSKSKEEITKEIQELSDMSFIHQLKINQIKKETIIDDFDFYRLYNLGKVSWVIDKRKQRNLIGNYFLSLYAKHFADQLEVSYNDIVWLTPTEFDNLVQGKNRISDFPINERKKESMYFIDIDGNDRFFIGEESRFIFKNISSEIIDDELDEIKGSIAWKGKITGTVKVVLDPKNPGDFKKGDILVTGMTRPDYFGLMKDASAFITDEGGVTCHAAIVAREMKKPCITGTKIATKILKDGMEVEVDADNGVVRIIKL